MRILLASVSAAPPEVFSAHFASALSLTLPPRVTLSYAYISDGLSEDTEKEITDAGGMVSEALPRPDGARYEVSETTHKWAEPTFDFVAREKQRLLEYAVEERFDAIFFVDSDLVLGEETLESLIYAEKDVVSAVFWTQWQSDAPPLPQVWLRHPYEFSNGAETPEEFLRSLEVGHALRPVGGLGACTLIRSRVFSKVRWWPLLEGLPSGGMWRGEDRSFCIHAARNHVGLFADAWPSIFHIYRPSDLGSVEMWKRSLAERPKKPEVGDFVSVALEPLEEKELFGRREHLRGRLGTLRLLPEIEDALFEMTRGDSKIVRVYFPLWWGVEAYRGKTKNLLVRLLDTKRLPE